MHLSIIMLKELVCTASVLGPLVMVLAFGGPVLAVDHSARGTGRPARGPTTAATLVGTMQ